MKRRGCEIIFVGTLMSVLRLAAPAAAAADPIPWFHERFAMSAGGWFAFSDSDLGANGALFSPRLDLEDDLNVDDWSLNPSFVASFRFLKRNRILGEYFYSSRDGAVVTGEDIEIGDDVIPAGSGVKTGLDIQAFRFAYGFSVLHSARRELALTLGLHLMDVNFTIQPVLGGVPDVSDSTGLSAPLPNVGLNGGWALNDRWKIGGDFLWLHLDLGKIEGEIYQGRLDVTYSVWRHLDAGVAFTIFGLGGNGTKDGEKVGIDSLTYGPQIFLQMRFGDVS